MDILNKNQKIAVEHVSGPCLVLAGPGSGKTRVIAHRIINLVKNKNVAPTRILAISFTKASSMEMKARTLKMGVDNAFNKVNFGTFHATFFRILRKYQGLGLESIISEIDRYKLIKSILKHLNISDYSDDDINDVLSEISYVKNELMNYMDFNSQIFNKDEFLEIYRLYEKGKKQYNKIDFDDMLIMTYELLNTNNDVLSIVRQVFKYILIDEFQDINRVQFETIRLIAHPNNNIFVVGDEDQSIYGFRGARPDFMLNFSKYFKGAQEIVLDTNYRSKRNIVDCSQGLIKNNKDRYDKNIVAKSTNEGLIKTIYPKDTDDEAIFIGKEILNVVNDKNAGFEYSDFAVIYRTNRQARAFVDAFLDLRIPFVLKDSAKTIYDHWVSLDILAYLRIAMDIGTTDDWIRIINKPFRYVSRDSISKASKGLNFFDQLMEDDRLKSYQKKDLNDLLEDLNYIKGLAPGYAISYIRSTLDYDRYILEYCNQRKIKSKQIVEILDEIETSAKVYKTNLKFFEHIDEVREEVKIRANKNANQINSESQRDGVILSTMHSSKGLEFRNVYVAGVNKGVIPYNNNDDENMSNSTLEEERRLLYVTITRAKENLTISSPQKRFGRKIDKSEFLKEIKFS
ncbi:ATP-dependent helicase [Peptostreptococcus equinus]|uniref:DNA 3'-5' helicase n=1 Tax=Peptostreptococcus equinus TaxID=3003601 RepID=A0ABY7JT96_9FIRM|nr:ATP-dependent helicase [Peptostreptococcus sp. CBA3647]WAW15195.1 ATP-dependent helicase [Peptostreptococcus sp. CBA3647]